MKYFKFQSILKNGWKISFVLLFFFLIISGCTTVGENSNISTTIIDKKESADTYSLNLICDNNITYEVKNNGKTDVEFVQVNISKIQTWSKEIESKIESIDNLKAGEKITKSTNFRSFCGDKYEFTIHQEPYQKVLY